jgi:hypothetical protein
MKNKDPYMVMSIERVRADAIAGIALARAALRTRAPEQARAIGLGVEHTARVMQAVGDYYSNRKRRGK